MNLKLVVLLSTFQYRSYDKKHIFQSYVNTLVKIDVILYSRAVLPTMEIQDKAGFQIPPFLIMTRGIHFIGKHIFIMTRGIHFIGKYIFIIMRGIHL